MQALDLRVFRAARYGLGQRLALPAAEQGGRKALGTSHFCLPRTSSYLAYTLGFRSQRIFFAGQRRAARKCFVGHEQWKVRLATVCFYSTISAVLSKWVRAARTQAARPAGSDVLEQENKQLRAQLARAEMKRDILKKALTIFCNRRADETLRFHCLIRSLLARVAAVPRARR